MDYLFKAFASSVKIERYDDSHQDDMDDVAYEPDVLKPSKLL